ncbi:MAG: sulfatase-like hydrolase/transferase [candidate division WS1 bacterium]|jgi:predicted AlkP superfamily phosphohydrolase/phosphomutase|nr:sulfatase-like hydrolase/transferase [candidate division WS1 bacterium]
MHARTYVGVLATLLCLCGPAAAQTPADHVFLVIVDGCAPRYLQRLDLPNIRSLVQAGVSTDRALTVRPSLTLPATASIVSGLPPSRHSVDWDEWRPDLGAMRVSSIFTEARRAGRSCAGFVGPRKLEHLAPAGVFGIFLSFGQTDEVVMSAALEHLRDPELRASLYFIHLPDLERAGTRYGWGSMQYMNAVLEVDRQIGRLLTTISRLGLSNRSAMVITSDHGGEANRHDVYVETIMRVPWIVAGVGVHQNYVIPTQVSVIDTAPTVLALMGISAPESWEGRVPERVLAR